MDKKNISNGLKKSVGRKRLPVAEKKVAVYFMVKKKNSDAFKKAVAPMIKLYNSL